MEFDESKRDFIKKSIALGLGIYGLTHLDFTAEAKTGDSTVVVARDQSVIDNNFKVDPGVIRKMLDDAILKASGAASVTNAWKKYFRSDDIVGIKVNTLSGRWMSSHPELVMAIADGLKLAGVKDILIWDRSDDELDSAGFKVNRKMSNAPRCFGTTPDVGYDDDITMHGSIGSRLSRIVSSYCTAFVNVPVLKHHTMAGVTISLKNWFGAINNPFKYHIDMSNSNRHIAASSFVPDLNSLLFSGLKKRQLIICDGIMSQYDMGPGYRPGKAWKYSGLIVSTDPVALDRIGAQIIEKKRREVGLKSLSETGRKPEYIAIAGDRNHRLGIEDLSRIELISAGKLEPGI